VPSTGILEGRGLRAVCYPEHMNERSFQDILEWVVLGLLIAVAALVVMWVGGWLFTFLGMILKGLASLIFRLLTILVPALIVAGAIYFILRFVQKPKSA